MDSDNSACSGPSGCVTVGFSSDYTRKVDRTVGISGRLPNAVYTLPPCLVQALIGCASVDVGTREALFVVCRKFYLANREYEESEVEFVAGTAPFTTIITLDCGRLYAEGSNRHGQCGVGLDDDVINGPRLIRLPPVLQVWFRDTTWFAKTTRGLYAWGMNMQGCLGIGSDVRRVRSPAWVAIGEPCVDVAVISQRGVSFIQTARGWYGSGNNQRNVLAVGHGGPVTAFTFLPGSERVTRLLSDGQGTVAWTSNALLGAGDAGRFGHLRDGRRPHRSQHHSTARWRSWPLHCH